MNKNKAKRAISVTLNASIIVIYAALTVYYAGAAVYTAKNLFE